MSGIPRPWHTYADGYIYGPDLRLVTPDTDGDFIVRACNAFDALLGVARAAQMAEDGTVGPEWIHNALQVLDAAHPEWRTW